MKKNLTKIYKNAKKIKIDNNSKIVIMSDCHRGSGNNFDNFMKNKNIFISALNYYFDNDFTYIELGDGDEMWEVKNYQEIIQENIDAFKLLKKFHDSNRLFMVYGNHDKGKKSSKILKKYFYKFYDEVNEKEEYLLNNLEVDEALILNYYNYDIFMLHGHQVDLLNSQFWLLAKFLVRYIWKNIERLGFKDPTSAAKNYKVTKKVEKRLEDWSIKNNKILIAGHTHRAIFPKTGNSLYFNDGSCIYPSGITCLEIQNGKITLVKWKFKIKKNNTIYVDKEIIKGDEPILNFFANKIG